MNLYQLTYVASPVVGAVAGGTTGARHGMTGVLAGAGIGLVSGLVLDFCALGCAALVRKVTVSDATRQTQGFVPRAWSGFVGKYMPMIAPILAAIFSYLLVKAVLK
jgi:hypothetical protein